MCTTKLLSANFTFSLERIVLRCGKISYCSVNLATCGRALSWSRYGPMNQGRPFFLQGNLSVWKLIAVMICFQKAVLDNIDCRLPNCLHNLLLMQLWLWEVFGRLHTIKPLTWLLTIIIKDPLLVTSGNSIKKGSIAVTLTKHWADFKSL